MKRNKIIGIAVATLGLALSVGTAVALYEKGVADEGFGIGAASFTPSTDTVQYKINDSNSPTVNPVYCEKGGTPTEANAFDNVSRAVSYDFKLGATFAETLTAQNYLMGNLSVTFNSLVSSLQGKIKVSMYFTGYVADTLGAQYYGSNMTTTNDAPINNTVVSGASLTVNARDICVSAVGTQHFTVFIELDDSVDVLAMDEASSLWNLGVTWGNVSQSFDAAYIANGRTLWAEDDEFVMAPNINKPSSQGWEWTAAITGASDLTLAKCRQNDSWENGDNHSLVAGTTYDVYWTGNGVSEGDSEGDAAIFTARS